MLDTLDVKWRVIAFDNSNLLLRAVGQLESRAWHAHPLHADVQLEADPGGLLTYRSMPGACAVSAEISVAGSALTIAGSAATADTDVIDASAQAGSPSKLFNVASAASPAILILHDLHLRGGSSAIHVEGPHASCNLTGVVITGFSGTQSSKEGVAIMVKSGAQVHLSSKLYRPQSGLRPSSRPPLSSNT